MAFKPCFSCGERFPGKAATLYGAWMGDEERISYTMKVCYTCVLRHVAPMVKQSIGADGRDSCCVCGDDVGIKQQDHIFLTAYLPKQPEVQWDLMGHSTCLTPAKAWYEEFGLWNKRPDLGGSLGPETPPGPAWELVW